MISTWELHFEQMPAECMERLENYLHYLMSATPDALDYMVDQEGCLHVMFEDLKHLRAVIDACDHRVRTKSLTVAFEVDVEAQLRSWSKHGVNTAEAKIELPWEVDDADHGSIELVTR